MTQATSVRTSAASIQIIADHLRTLSAAQSDEIEISEAVVHLESVAADLLMFDDQSGVETAAFS
ncbi:MAG: hypothetical protein CMM48_13180 [Rhodospirillaceae bacterium]|nr:hypothetical protein [Rhodospirillaceae bacterium]|tara:strand:+ start:205 stop:396 length:192 start_codon:yes stop_codon:yes gene_type:complete